MTEKSGAPQSKSKARHFQKPGSKTVQRSAKPGPKTVPKPVPQTREASHAAEPPGLLARRLATRLIGAVIEDGRALDDAFTVALASPRFAGLEPRDRAFARIIATTALRRLGELEGVLKTFLEKPLPADRGRLRPMLLSGAAQLLFLETPPHAAISLAVDECRGDPKARRFDRLVNAVLRRVSEKGAEILKSLDSPRVNIPEWLWRRWVATYGEGLAKQIAAASLEPAALDISVKSDAARWAERLGGIVLRTGAVRLEAEGRIEDMAGFADGEWWVQDAAAALPARLFGAVKGLKVADLCAAPGGKTAELAVAGAFVTAVDISGERLKRVTENLGRLKLTAELVEADATAWDPGCQFDAVLLDAPCTATGTIRRHPDILRLKRETDVGAIAGLQTKLLDAAARLVKPDGTVVYCTCSLEPEEGRDQIAALLGRNSNFTRVPIDAAEFGGESDWITADGDLRTLPCHFKAETPALSGLDGFYAARLKRVS